MNNELNEREAWAWAHASRVLVNEYRNGSVAELGPFGGSGPSPHAAINALRRTMKLSRRPVEAQAKGGAEAQSEREEPIDCRCEGETYCLICGGYTKQSRSHTPPAAEAREEVTNSASISSKLVTPHPEPQAPRVSEEAMISLKTASESMHFFPRVDREICRELFRALSQPAQGEGKTEAEEKLIDYVLDDGNWCLKPSLFAEELDRLRDSIRTERAKGREQSPT